MRASGAASSFYVYVPPPALLQIICLPLKGTPPLNTAADTAHSAHSTQPALRLHRATPRVEDKPLQTRRPHSICTCACACAAALPRPLFPPSSVFKSML